MDFSLEAIKNDLKKLPEKEFLTKYLLKSDNWYFSEYQNKSETESIVQMETLKDILNEYFGVAFHNVLMVGSGKIGYSLSPTDKLFKKFDEGDESSDIDIAIISSRFFDYLWEEIRKEYSIKYISSYSTITSSIFRGFINEKNFKNINEIISSHGARRFFVGTIYNEVQDPNLIGELSGHSYGSRAFSRYRNVNSDLKKKLVAILDENNQ